MTLSGGDEWSLGVSKKPGNRNWNWKTEKPGSRFRFWFGKTKNRVPRFRYPVFTGNRVIYILVRALHFKI